jgi:hypothetical protein
MPSVTGLTDRGLLEHGGELGDYVTKYGLALGIDMAWFNDMYTLRYKEYEADFHNNEDKTTRSTLTAEAKELARKALEPEVRKLELMLIANTNVSELTLISLHIAIAKGGGGHAPKKVEDKPLVKINTSNPTRVGIEVRNLKTGKFGRPEGATNALIRVGLVGADPDDHDVDKYRMDDFVVNHKDLPYAIFTSNGKVLLEFDERESGLKLQIAVCWRNVVGDEGPWTGLIVATIPEGVKS